MDKSVTPEQEQVQARVITAICSRCFKEVEGIKTHEGSSGFYVITPESPWNPYVNKGETIVCDNCMHNDRRYLYVYGPANTYQVTLAELMQDMSDIGIEIRVCGKYSLFMSNELPRKGWEIEIYDLYNSGGDDHYRLLGRGEAQTKDIAMTIAYHRYIKAINSL